MKLLITGVTGQLGAALARSALARGHAVRGLVRDPARMVDLPGVERIAGDLHDPAGLEGAMRGVDAVFHAAGLVSYLPARAADLRAVNVEGTRALLAAAQAAGVERFVFTSSIAAGGPVAGAGEGDEDTPFAMEGQGFVYGETKRAAEDLVCAAGGLALRPGIILGAGDRNINGGRMILDLLAGKIPGVPSGATTLAVLDDVVEGHFLALERGTAGARYILGGTTGSFQELYSAIAATLGVAPPRWVLPDPFVAMVAAWRGWRAPADGPEPTLTPLLARLTMRNRRFSSARAIAQLGYRPSPLATGVRAAVDWFTAEGLLPR